MLIALLAVLGVDLAVIVVLLVFVVSRKRWVMKQSDAFRGAIRVTLLLGPYREPANVGTESLVH